MITTGHMCPLPRVRPADQVPDEEVLWSCGCGLLYRLNPIVLRWYRYFPPTAFPPKER
jgi:hypothetical protein